MAFIINRRTRTNATATATGALPSGALQVTDLWPNVSQRNQIYSPVGLGPQYCNPPEKVVPTEFIQHLGETVVNQTVNSSGGLGLLAYLLMNVDRGGSGDNLTFFEALACQDAIITQAEAGGSLQLGVVNAIIDAVVTGMDASVAGTVFNATASTFDYLRILAGYKWTLASGTPFQTRASATITINNAAIVAADTVTITVGAGAQVLTEGVDFTTGATAAATATSLATAINAVAALTPGFPAPPQADGVRASASGGVVTLRATLGGTSGNAIALATGNVAAFVLSGATFAGGAQILTSTAQNQAAFGAFRHIPDVDSSLAGSCLNGTLARLRDPALSLFGAANPEPVVQVYNGDGSVFT